MSKVFKYVIGNAILVLLTFWTITKLLLLANAKDDFLVALSFVGILATLVVTGFIVYFQLPKEFKER